jgi:hypothetical protein
MRLGTAVRALVDAEVEFVVVDGLAANLHGTAHVTLDLGICYSRTTSNLRSLVAALAPFHPRLRGFPKELPFVWDETVLRNATVLTLLTDLGEIDLLAEVAGDGMWDDVKARSILVEAFDRRISILDLPSLIRARRAAGLAKGLAVLPELESLLEACERQRRSPNKDRHECRPGRQKCPRHNGA